MFKRMTGGLMVLALLLASACSEMGDYARTSAVHDGMRALGLALMPDGTYEFKLCEMEEAYTPEVLEKRCINPLIAEDGLPLVLNELPDHPGTLTARVRNWGLTLVAATAAGLVVYGLGRYIAKGKATSQLTREAYAEGLERSMNVSKTYPHFELPEGLKDRLLKEVVSEEDMKDFKHVGDEFVERENVEPITHLKFADKIKFKSGKQVDLRELLENKKLQKKLTPEEKREVSELLVELEESLKSGEAYLQTLTKGLEEMNKEGIPLVDGVLGKIVKEDSNGSFFLDPKRIKEPLEKNRPLDEEYHEALQKLDQQVTEVLGKEAESIRSRQRNIARLEAAAGLDEVLKKVEGAGDRAVATAQKGNEQLRALTESHLRNMIEEFGALVEDGAKTADEVKTKLADMQKEIEDTVKTWDEQAEELADIATDDVEVVKNMQSFIKSTRKKMIKGWSKQAKEANKELQERFKTPAYETGAKDFYDNAHKAVHSSSVRINAEVKEAGEKAVERIGKVINSAERKLAESQLGDNIHEITNKDSDLVNELLDIARAADSPTDLKKITEAVRNSSLFKSTDQQIADDLAALRDETTAKVEDIIESTQEELINSKESFFKGIASRMKNFKLSDNKIFHYWDKDIGELPRYKNTDKRIAVRVIKRQEVVSRLADHEDVGAAQVKKGFEKLLGHVTTAATFVAIPVTSLRKKLSGHARLNAAKRWGALTGSYELTAEGRIDDMRTIIEGIAEIMGAKVSDEVFYFMLRSGMRSKQ